MLKYIAMVIWYQKYTVTIIILTCDFQNQLPNCHSGFHPGLDFGGVGGSILQVGMWAFLAHLQECGGNLHRPVCACSPSMSFHQVGGSVSVWGEASHPPPQVDETLVSHSCEPGGGRGVTYWYWALHALWLPDYFYIGNCVIAWDDLMYRCVSCVRTWALVDGYWNLLTFLEQLQSCGTSNLKFQCFTCNCSLGIRMLTFNHLCVWNRHVYHRVGRLYM